MTNSEEKYGSLINELKKLLRGRCTGLIEKCNGKHHIACYIPEIVLIRRLLSIWKA